MSTLPIPIVMTSKVTLKYLWRYKAMMSNSMDNKLLMAIHTTSFKCDEWQIRVEYFRSNKAIMSNWHSICYPNSKYDELRVRAQHLRSNKTIKSYTKDNPTGILYYQLKV